MTRFLRRCWRTDRGWCRSQLLRSAMMTRRGHGERGDQRARLGSNNLPYEGSSLNCKSLSHAMNSPSFDCPPPNQLNINLKCRRRCGGPAVAAVGSLPFQEAVTVVGPNTKMVIQKGGARRPPRPGEGAGGGVSPGSMPGLQLSPSEAKELQVSLGGLSRPPKDVADAAQSGCQSSVSTEANSKGARCEARKSAVSKRVWERGGRARSRGKAQSVRFGLPSPSRQGPVGRALSD